MSKYTKLLLFGTGRVRLQSGMGHCWTIDAWVKDKNTRMGDKKKTPSSKECNQWELEKMNSCLTHLDIWVRGPQQEDNSSVNYTATGGGRGQREAYQRGKRERSKECGAFESENSPITEKRWEKLHKKKWAELRGTERRFTKDQEGRKRHICQVEFQQDALPEPLPLAYTPPSSTHTHTAFCAPKLVCEVLPPSH